MDGFDRNSYSLTWRYAYSQTCDLTCYLLHLLQHNSSRSFVPNTCIIQKVLKKGLNISLFQCFCGTFCSDDFFACLFKVMPETWKGNTKHQADDSLDSAVFCRFCVPYILTWQNGLSTSWHLSGRYFNSPLARNRLWSQWIDFLTKRTAATYCKSVQCPVLGTLISFTE
jgi:hypothetical protein